MTIEGPIWNSNITCLLLGLITTIAASCLTWQVQAMGRSCRRSACISSSWTLGAPPCSAPPSMAGRRSSRWRAPLGQRRWRQSTRHVPHTRWRDAVPLTMGRAAYALGMMRRPSTSCTSSTQWHKPSPLTIVHAPCALPQHATLVGCLNGVDSLVGASAQLIIWLQSLIIWLQSLIISWQSLIQCSHWRIAREGGGALHLGCLPSPN